MSYSNTAGLASRFLAATSHKWQSPALRNSDLKNPQREATGQLASETIACAFPDCDGFPLQGSDKSKDRGPDAGLRPPPDSMRCFPPNGASCVMASWPPLPPLRYRARLFGWLRERISLRTMPQVPRPSRSVGSSIREIRDPPNGGPRWATCRPADTPLPAAGGADGSRPIRPSLTERRTTRPRRRAFGPGLDI